MSEYWSEKTCQRKPVRVNSLKKTRKRKPIFWYILRRCTALKYLKNWLLKRILQTVMIAIGCYVGGLKVFKAKRRKQDQKCDEKLERNGFIRKIFVNATKYLGENVKNYFQQDYPFSLIITNDIRVIHKILVAILFYSLRRFGCALNFFSSFPLLSNMIYLNS